jgi:voltage-gated potassium channel Kch
MARSMLGFKDLFLVGFFLTIGMTGQLSIEALVIGIMLVPFVLLKSGLVFWLLTRFKLRARTSLLATLNLSNYSEFGLIVIAIGVASGWINGDWLVIAALAISFSFIVASWLTENDDAIYRSRQKVWLEFQRRERLPDDLLLDTRGATVAVFGMGRVGSGAYDKMREFHGETVVGFDFDSDVVQRHRSMNRNVLLGDPSDADFWDKVANDHGIKLVMLALPNLQSKLDAVSQLQANSYDGWIAATAKYPDEMSKLRDSGVSAVFNFYTEAGAGFADHVETQLKALSDMGTEGRPTTGH